uniref:Uncharacterized protein n=1 Tax=Physcomitrium patens TaxID=3218 RepID=A0A2K1K4B9_PHYPA|nr:hypothetical protein PHYPA_013085 [Physcomitrium patens]
MFSREVNYYTDVELRDDYENNTLRIDAERYLQRPSYHFRPEKDWMNGVSSTTCLLSKDPCFYNGFYHFFYQYNPHGAVWGNIVWGHAVSRDMIHWQHLDIALILDKWYDIQGVWSGSVTMREDGVPIILYTGSSYASEQTQCIANPADPSDPLLRKWVKDHENPILRFLIQAADVNKGWSSVQAIPRAVWLDRNTLKGLIQDPIEEVKTLRGSKVQQGTVKLAPGEVLGIRGATGRQLDIEVVFEYPDVTHTINSGTFNLDRDLVNCNQGGAAHRGLFGPFGLLVLADENLREQTAIFFYISYSRDQGKRATSFCSDQSRSSLLSDVATTVYGSFVEILPSEDSLSLRVLVDKSIVESFVQGGRMVITSRVYPIIAMNKTSHLYFLNNATTSINVRSIDVWQMHPAAYGTLQCHRCSAAIR